MERKEAVATVKEFGSHSINEPSFVVLKKSGKGKFNLLLKKSECDIMDLNRWVSHRNLVVEEDRARDLLIISKP